MASNRLATGNPSTRVVVGLGNAERQYQRTRHNLGARAVGEAVAQLGLRATPGLVAVPMSRSGFVLPAGFMNDSGEIVLKAVERIRDDSEAAYTASRSSISMQAGIAIPLIILSVVFLGALVARSISQPIVCMTDPTASRSFGTSLYSDDGA